MITGYRADLDGLRTVAVYLVLLFHAGLSWFAGGFIGVDLFFVLSGFLVSSLLIGELQESGSLRLGRFYSRRIRRLLPAAVVVIVATGLVFTLLWSVVRRASLVHDAVSALLYYANIHFMMASGDYFAANVDKSPYLHFWSLSIEEQFYAFFPVLLLLLFRVRGPRRRPVVLGVLTTMLVLSLADQVYFALNDVNRAYYGTDTRLYQLLAGALLTATLALTAYRFPARAAQPAAVAGLAGVVLMGSGLWNLSPSARGIGATVAAVLLLGGLAQAQGSVLSRMLAAPPVAYLGRISYGTYLWHWPVIIALTTVLDLAPLTLAVLTFALATGLAALSSELLELPVRRNPRLDAFTWPVVLTGLTTSVLVAALVIPPILHRPTRPALLDASPAAGPAAASSGTTVPTHGLLATELAAAPPQVDYVHLSQEAGDFEYCLPSDLKPCRQVTNGGPTVLLVGDSQAETFIPVFRQLANEHHVNLDVNVFPGCSWQEGLTNPKLVGKVADTCAQTRAGWYEKALPQLHPDVVVLLSRPRDSPADWGATSNLADGTMLPLRQAVAQETRATLAKVTAVAPVIVIQRLVMPETFSVTDCLAAARTVGECAVTPLATPSFTDGVVSHVAEQNPRVHPVDLNPIFCPTVTVCSPVRDGQVVWRDDHHYTVDYAMSQRARIWAALAKTGLPGLTPSS